MRRDACRNYALGRESRGLVSTQRPHPPPMDPTIVFELVAAKLWLEPIDIRYGSDFPRS